MCMIQYRLWIGALPNETTTKLLRKIETHTNHSPVLVRGPETRTHVTPPINNEERRVWRFQGREIMRTWLLDSAIFICGESSDRGAPARHGSSEGRGVVGRRRSVECRSAPGSSQRSLPAVAGTAQARTAFLSPLSCSSHGYPPRGSSR